MAKRIFSTFNLIFLFWLLSFTNAYADPCSDIEGHWRGVWNAPYARCMMKAEAHITKNDQQIIFNMHLFDGEFPSRCDDSSFTMTGTCVDGKLTVQHGRFQISGVIKKGEINLSPVDEYVWLKKVN